MHMWKIKEKTRLRTGCPECGTARIDGQECTGCKKQNQVAQLESAKGATPVLIDVSNLDRVQIPSLWRRAAATGIDLTLLWMLQWITIPYGLLMLTSQGAMFDNLWSFAGLGLMVLWYSAIEWWLYAAVFESSPLMATPGKLALGLVALDTKGRRLTFFQASKRILSVSLTLGLISILSVGLIVLSRKTAGTIWMINLLVMPACFLFAFGNSNRQTLFDYACGRIVLFRKSLPETMQHVDNSQLKGLKQFIIATALFGLALNTIPVVELTNGAALFLKLEIALANEARDPKSLETAQTNMQERYPDISRVYSSLADLVRNWSKPLQESYLSKAIRFARDDGENSRLPVLLIDHAKSVYPKNDKLAINELDEANKLIADNPKQSSQVHEVKSEIFKQKGNTKAAIEEITLAIADDPLEPEYFKERARLRSLAHDKNAALDNQRADDVTNINYGSLYDLQMASYKERLSALQKLTKIAPESISAKAYLAKTKYGLLDFDSESSKSSKQGLKDIESLRAKYPTNAVVLKLAAEMWEQEGNNKKAMEIYTSLLDIKPTAKSYLRRGDLYEEIRKHNLAISDYTHAIELDKGEGGAMTSARIFASRAMSNAKQGKFQDAIDDYTEALTLCPGDSEWILARANMYEMLGHWDKAVEGLSTGIDDPETFNYTKADLQCARARMLMHLGKTKEALADCNACLDTNSLDAEALYIRAKLYDRLGRKKDAKADREAIKQMYMDDLEYGSDNPVEASDSEK
jgi:tetratricopeptide (TPR) repeat protein/uncharacterized RDD family membrane protein YckC